jgi:predicted CoA-binding protein
MSILLKVDVEGSEVEVLRGASKILTSAKNVKISCASYHYTDEIYDVSRLLHKMGFKILVSRNYIIYAVKA